MPFQLVILLLSSSQVTFSLNIPRSIESHALWDHRITYYANCIPVTSIAEPAVTTTTRIFNLSAVSANPGPNTDTTRTIISSDHSESTKSHPDHASLTAVSSGTSATTASHSTITSQVVAPGRNGTPACAYILAADMGPSPACAQDHCDCDGTIAPLISSSVGGAWTTNCDYIVQPITSSCPAPVTTVGGDIPHPHPSLIVIETVVHVQPVCTATVGGGETCGYSTFTSVTTIGS